VLRDGTALRTPTQCERILAVISDGREHTAAELYRTGCVLHSRISDLRKRGYVIELSRADGVGAESFLYKLVATPEEATSAAVVSSGTAATAEPHPAASVAEHVPELQLALVVA
jgi:hypothetical protein